MEELSVPEVARRLGISERAVRRRIERGTLAARKEGPAWVVRLPAEVGGTVPPPVPPQVPPGTAPVPEQAPPPPVDLAPLAALLDRLTAENRQLAEAATAWQLRAHTLEERLAQLTAGDVADEGGTVPPPIPPPEEPGTAPVPPPALWQRVRRWLRGT